MVIRISRATEVEVKERKDRVEDAMHATRAAVEEGILPGSGVALLYAAKALDALSPANDDQRVGIDIVRRALQAPVRQIAENAGEDGAVIAGKLTDKVERNRGFDAQTGQSGDMLKAGIIDPTKVVRTALQDVASVASILVTTEAMVAEKPKTQESRPAGAPEVGAMMWAAPRHGTDQQRAGASAPVRSLRPCPGPQPRPAPSPSLLSPPCPCAAAAVSWPA